MVTPNMSCINEEDYYCTEMCFNPQHHLSLRRQVLVPEPNQQVEATVKSEEKKKKLCPKQKVLKQTRIGVRFAANPGKYTFL